MIVYDRLWKTMKERQISQYKLDREYGFSPGQIARLRKNENITIYTLNRLCEILQCRVEDIIEYRPDEPEASA
jgi:DNA-binding Xre family transcriptional regulator